MVLALLLAGCAYEFGMTSTPKNEGGGLDTGGDTAANVETDDTPADSDTADTADDGNNETGNNETGDTPTDSGGDTAVDTATDTATDTGSIDTATEDDPAPEDDCTETDDLIYVLARDDGRLYTFDPSTLHFTDLGRVNCGTSQTPGSMAVDRSGTAYVRYADNTVYSVDLATMTCSRTGYSDRTTGFDSFGMGYATDNADTWREQLYVANDSQVGILDPATWRVTTLGRMPSQSELTGNADGELWAMLPLERPAELVRLDTTTGATMETLHLASFPDPSNIDTFAFATWSGSFYLFVRESGMGNSTDVYEVTSTGTMSRVLTGIGFDVVGAGVSTCAPS